MFRDAYKEVRLHPGRVIATLIAIAISVGFMSAVSIFINTQSNSLGKTMSLITSKADVVAEFYDVKPGTTAAAVEQKIRSVPGIEKVEQSSYSPISLSSDAGNKMVYVYALPSEDFRWATLKQGAWPSKPTDVTISQQTADKLKVAVGQQVDIGQGKLTVTGISNEPPSLFFDSAYVTPATATEQGATQATGTWLMKTKAGTDNHQVVTGVHDALAGVVIDPDTEIPGGGGQKNLEVNTATDAQANAVKSIAGGFDVMRNVLLVFSAIAALVGMIIISNTFTILLAQRRRQIGLLRAVGASGSQVRRRFLAEAVLLGVIGSVLGLVLGSLVAWLATHLTKADYWGLNMPWGELLIEAVIGIVLTVLAAMLPSLRATRVAPLEALQPVATSEQVKRASIVRSIICGLLAVVGLALVLLSLSAPTSPAITGPVARAVVGSLLLTLGVLFGAPLYIPLVLRLFGKLVGPFGATPKLAAANAVRNPRRASATATALMLACGLIITLQVGTATAEKTALKEIKTRDPIDVAVSQMPYDNTGKPQTQPLSSAVQARVKSMPNVAASATLQGGHLTTTGNQAVDVRTVVAADPSTRAVNDTVPTTVSDTQVLTTASVKQGTKVTLKGNGHTVTLTSVPSHAIQEGQGMVSPTVMRQLVAKPGAQVIWLKLANADDIGSVMTQMQRLSATDHSVDVGGSAIEAYILKRVLSTLLMVITGLLGAAVLIALIGVSNTLGLSVIERAKESALLRALGMQRGSLRLMLLVEALLLALSGVLVGMLLGTFFGWIGIRAVLKQMSVHSPVQFSVNWGMTLGLLAITVLAAALASILPGRKAATAAPTEALAEE